MYVGGYMSCLCILVYIGVQHILHFWRCFSSCVTYLDSLSGLSFVLSPSVLFNAYLKQLVHACIVQYTIMRQIPLLALLSKGQPGFVFSITQYEIQCK